MEYTYECPGGSYRCDINDNNCIIKGYSGRPYEINIPDYIEGVAVREIDKKAFLGAKALVSVSLPESIVKIGDWGFASCDHLERFEIRGNAKIKPELGQGVFSKNSALKSISFKETDIGLKDKLIAAAATIMDAEYLLVEDEHFFAQWDVKLMSILDEKDDEGFVFMVLCGEEDLAADIDEYCELRRRRKSTLSFLRLLNSSLLSEVDREKLSSYLIDHSCGCESRAAFDVLLEHSEDEEYQALFLELPMVTDDNFEMVLEALGDRYAPLKAKVLSWREDNRESTIDFFDSFEL